VTSASLTYDATPTTNDFNEDCYKYSENSNGFSATNLVIPAVVSADGGSTAYKTFLANNAFQQALLSGSITFSEGTKQIGTDSDSDGI
jgi:hypothetical protein